MKALLFALALSGSFNLFAQPSSESKYYTDSIYSESLKEYRLHNIYIPKGFDPKRSYKVIYATDGMIISDEKKYIFDFKAGLDSLIGSKVIDPVIFVASYCNSNKCSSYMITGTGDTIYQTFRYFDYVLNSPLDANGDSALVGRYSRHGVYFEGEFIPTVEKRLKLKVASVDRIFYGYSNGAGFGVSFMNSHPDVIGQFVCFSPVGVCNEELKWEKRKYPKMYVGYGSEEHEFIADEAKTVEKEMKKVNADCSIITYKGKHGSQIGAPAFFRLLTVLAASANG